MKNSLTPIILGHKTPARYGWVKPCLHLLFALLLILAPILLARAQKVDGPITVSGLSSHTTPNGTAVSITADSSLSRAQTWQDKASFHVVIPDAGDYQSKEAGNVVEDETQNQGVLASVFSGKSVVVVLVMIVVGLLVIRKSRPKVNVTTSDPDSRAAEESETVEPIDDGSPKVDRRASRGATLRANQALSPNGSSRVRNAVARPVVNVPGSLFGAYRIDQEVGKLVLGQPHRMDVLSSRATDDRRAIETSLVKAIVATDSTDEERQRARQAMGEYGFVSRQSASLLLAHDAFERTSAARSLGEIGSESALPFLLEALYDAESIVRNQAVVSIGELKVPSAIGALLDMVRKQPDVPYSLVSRALSACSVDGLSFFEASVPATSFLTSGAQDSRLFGITHLEPASCVEDLPESIDDEGLEVALAKVGSEDVEERSESAKSLAQFPVKSSVDALISLAQHDPEFTVRSLAVSSLAFIDHESVFPAVLTGMADESREVRAAAARALSRLSFDRADAYTTVIETADGETLGRVAQACIKAGIVSQNIDRLATGDRHQAYEAFSLICLLAKVRMTAPVLDAIMNHPNVDVRVSAVHLLGVTGEDYLFDQLQKLAVMNDIDEEVKTALLEAMYKLEQAKLKEEVPAGEFVIRDSQEEFETFERTEAKLREDKSRRQIEEGARINAEREAHLAEKARIKAEEELHLRAEAEKRRNEQGEEDYRSQFEQSELGIDVVPAEKGIVPVSEESDSSAGLLLRLHSTTAEERVGALTDLARLGGDDAFLEIGKAFDDQSPGVRNAAARALYDLQPDRAASFTRALREGTPDRRRNIGASLAASGLASDAVANLTGESREKTYDAFSLLFLMAKAGEVHPLMKVIEDYPNLEVRLAVVKLLALSGQPEIVPAFRRLAVRGSLPSEVRSAVMEAIYQISSQNRESATPAAQE